MPCYENMNLRRIALCYTEMDKKQTPFASQYVDRKWVKFGLSWLIESIYVALVFAQK